MNSNKDYSVEQEIVDTITDKRTFVKSVKVKINYTKRWQRILSVIFILPKYHKKSIYLSNLWPGTVIRLLGVLLNLQSSKSFQEVDIYSMIKSNLPLFIDFLAIGLHNDETEPPEWLVRAITYQFESTEIQQYIIEVYRRLDVQTFFVTTQSLIDLQSLSSILEAEVPTQSSGTSVNTTDGPKGTSSGG